jgi:hypothetical protein
MIISDKQIMCLLTIAQGAMQTFHNRDHEAAAHDIASLIDAINRQQSEELKNIGETIHEMEHDSGDKR